MDFRRILLLIAFIIATLGIGFALYWFFFRAPEVVTPPVNVPPVNVGPGLPPSQEGIPGAVTPGVPGVLPEVQPGAPAPIADGGLTAVTPVAPVPTVGASISPSGQVNYYNRTDGKFYRLLADGTTQALSDRVFFNVRNATFDPGGTKAILEYPDGSNIFFDFTTSQQVTLPAHWEDFDFDPTGEQIVTKSIASDPNSRFLVVSSPTGGGARAIQELGANQDKVIVDWSPNNQVVATATTGTKLGVDRYEVHFVGLRGENFKSMTVDGLDFRPSWSPDGTRMLYSAAGSASDWKPQLWIVDAQGDSIGANRRSINVKTWADKCTFADPNTVYCGVPVELPRGAGLEPSIADGTPDDIVRIDLRTGLQTRVAQPEGSHTVGKIMLSPDGSKLYFTDKSSGVLNTIRLK